VLVVGYLGIGITTGLASVHNFSEGARRSYGDLTYSTTTVPMNLHAAGKDFNDMASAAAR
jgi:hypothetical protein